jgi:hypothetical protein
LCKEGHTTLFINFAIFESRIPVKSADIKPSQHKARIRYRQAYPTDSANIKQTNKTLTNDSKT